MFMFAYLCRLGEACSQIAALLFLIEHVVRRGLGTFSETESCTSQLCQWNAPKRQKVDPVQLAHIAFLKPEYGKIEKGIQPSAFDPRHPSDREMCKPTLHNLLQSVGQSMPGCAFMQLWDQEAICRSPHKVPPAEVSVEVQPEPSLDDQLQLLIVSPDADALLNIKDQSETEIVAYCQTYASEQHIHSALADWSTKRGQNSSELWHALHHGRLTSSRFGEIFHRRHTTPTDRLVSSIMGYSSVYPTHAMIRGLACEQRQRKTTLHCRSL